jgi:hypothetical protein
MSLNKLAEVNVVIQHEMLRQCVRDTPRAIHFSDWEFSGFAPHPNTARMLFGIIGARHKKDGQYYTQRVQIDAAAVEQAAMLGQIDIVMMQAVTDLVIGVLANPTVSECCGAPIDFMASIPLCVKCNGELFRDGRVYAERHKAGHNERCGLQSEAPARNGFILNSRFGRGKTFAVIYKHPAYGEPDYKSAARMMVMDCALEAGMPIARLGTNVVELEPHCLVVLIDEKFQDPESRGCRFDSVYVMPPATFIGEGMRRAMAPTKA